MPMHDWTRVGAGIYHHFHGRWLYAVAAALNCGVLPPGFYALADQIVQPFEPDVIALRRVTVRHISGHRVVALVELVSPGNKSGRRYFAAF
ncbi:MAG TPA: DUF4058 domain-containing protein, partial [Urbifossiella sp.]|nr:DUF4058 domain-containing protein [Urbifossiella sp.]